ncbi:hypothetical protein [Maridesulfovibrio salexigens]|uniref:Uncharacterized protein n=1 Tax=Maridesulfovibrio salexigens (strain ATCC 14822 / DSM 2638 / NCIMB 8403 / VKM B-1763) TaxID=526222 RepID=C6BU54_MARSD|nr:hypothetical protein [Maridesulfovibrio salexigens]ACS81763.1 conserved hypothetical protein [Maridesulfovibrio salexigens DSM 2638]
MLKMDYLEKLEKYMTSGDMKFEFDNGTEEKRFEILEFLEKLMDVAEIADEHATKLIFKGGLLEALSGANQEEEK